jgi:3-dehydroquinate synthetase
MEIIEARQGEHRYEVRVGEGATDGLGDLAAAHDRVALLSCARVLRTPFGRAVARRLAREANVALVHVLPDGERGKTLAELERASTKLLKAGLTRRSLVVSLGGGAVSDAAGFLAATFMRGIPWAAAPTTLLSMVDAAIGGKTGVNLPVAKNAVGAFHPPVAVLADPRALATLPARELRSGMGEVLKYAALEPAMLGRVAGVAPGRPPAAELVAACAQAKVRVVAADPNEKGARKLLNLGHTFGHGVEAAGAFERYTHGEAVSVGLAYAFRLAAILGRIGPLAVAEVERAIADAGLPIRVPAAVARRAVALMGFDKKRTAAGLRWVLPVEDGATWRVEWDVAAPDGAVAEAVREISEPARRGSTKGRRR